MSIRDLKLTLPILSVSLFIVCIGACKQRKEIASVSAIGENEFPLSEHLSTVNYIVGSGHCSAAVVGTNLLLTAAHCVKNLKGSLLIGNLVTGSKGEQIQYREFNIEEGIFAHEMYGDPSCRKERLSPKSEFETEKMCPDIAFIQTKEAINVKPIPLWLGKLRPGDSIRVGGWGRQSDELTPGPSNPDSEPVVLKYFETKVEKLLADVFTTPRRNSNGEARLAVGDSGGPVYQEISGKLYVVGVNNWAKATEDGKIFHWSAFQRLDQGSSYPFIDWLNRILPKLTKDKDGRLGMQVHMP